MATPKVTTQPEEKRIKNFNEVSLGYSKKLSSEEARRCPQCTDPVCVAACPIGINIPGFIRHLREGDVAGAYRIVRESSCLPSVCGRICSAPCELACVLTEENAPIGIRALERYVADFGAMNFRREKIRRAGKKIAVVGSGPSGLTAAHELSQKDYQVTVFESLEKPGGVLRYGIPEFRIPKRILDGQINEIKAQGVEIETNFLIGQTKSIEELTEEGFAAILLSTGAGVPKFMDLKGSNYGGVYYGEEFLMRVNLMKTKVFSRHIPAFVFGEKIAVIGSGNTALDCARAARRFGREVTLVFRATEDEMRVRNEERDYAKEEGIRLEPLTKPVEIIADQNNFVNGLKCIRMDYADTNSNENWQLIPVPDSEFTLDVDTVIIAIGHGPNSFISKISPKLKLNVNGTIKVNDKNQTSIPKVFACGNVVTNAGNIVDAMAAGKNAAHSIDHFLKG